MISAELAPLPTQTYFQLHSRIENAKTAERTTLMRDKEHYLEHGLHAIGSVLDDRPSFNISNGGIIYVSPEGSTISIRTSALDEVEAAYRIQDGCDVSRVDDETLIVNVHTWPSDPGADCCNGNYPSPMSLM